MPQQQQGLFQADFGLMCEDQLCQYRPRSIVIKELIIDQERPAQKSEESTIVDTNVAQGHEGVVLYHGILVSETTRE